MPDDFQQFKGLLGQQIAKLHLEKIKRWRIAGEEVEVEGVSGRARLDIVAQRNGEAFSPVEVKFQEYNLERYGVAFEHVLNELGNGRDVYSKDRNGNRLKLSQPVSVDPIFIIEARLVRQSLGRSHNDLPGHGG